MRRPPLPLASFLALALGFAGTGALSGTSSSAAGVAPCPVCGVSEGTGALGDKALREVSGVVASLAHPGVFWVHNDSGDVPRFFAVDRAGKRLATLSVTNAQAVDWEDVARGPCPAGTCLYLADIGDNRENRASYTLYRVAEPATVADAAVTAERFDFTYADGAHNAEALLVHPTTGAVTIVTKAFRGLSSIYEMALPPKPGATVVLKEVGRVKSPTGSGLITGGDVHPLGRGLLLRTYSEVWYYPMASGDSVAAALSRTPCPMPTARELQGEAVGWLADGVGYVTISEGVGAKMNRVACGGLTGSAE